MAHAGAVADAAVVTALYYSMLYANISIFD